MSAVLEIIERDSLPAPKQNYLGSPQSIRKLYREFRFSHHPAEDIPVISPELEGLTWYNLAALVVNGRLVVLGRVDPPDSEQGMVSSFDVVGRIPAGLVISRNGINIENAQDPFVGQINGRPVVGVVDVRKNPNDPGCLINRTKIFQLSEDGSRLVNPEEAATSPNDGKDTRVNDIAVGHILIEPRFRNDRFEDSYTGKVESHLKMGIVPAPRELQDLTPVLKEVSQDLSKKVQVLTEEGYPWVGSNHLTVLEKEGPYEALEKFPWLVPTGRVYHAAFFTGRRFPNGEKGRSYIAAELEAVIDLRKGRAVSVGRSKIIATVDMLGRRVEPKREDLEDVLFPGTLLVGTDNEGIPVTTYLTYGANDREAGFLKIRYPYSAAPDPEFNKYTVVHESILNRYLAA